MKKVSVALRISLTIFFTLLLFVPPVLAADHFHVFIYHRFGDARYPSTNISLAAFAAQMRYLHDHGYQVMRAGEAIALWRAKKSLPPKAVVLTVDDAYTSFKTGAMPILRQYNFPVTLFVNTDSVGRKDSLDWNELRELAKEGVEIGNHTATHDSLTAQRTNESIASYRQRLHRDIDRAQQAIIRELGLTPQLFAYPYGEYSSLTREVVEEYGFVAAFAQHSGVIGKDDPPFALARTPLTGSYATLNQMQQKLALRPLPVEIIAPADTLLGRENPPTLILEVLDPQLDLNTLRLFVNGQPGGMVQRDAQHARRIIVRGSKPLGEGRSRYILTAPGREAGTFYAYTQFWLSRSSRP
ncbi:MAG: polysaccharide deacetylase family protein [Desulfuromonadales bacterium]|nr:polysaccharide deacetylase family protein [Desulfuromonadales bacterium]